MRKQLKENQLSNWRTYQMYLREMLTLAENVFEFENLPEFIDVSFLNKNCYEMVLLLFSKMNIWELLLYHILLWEH